MAYSDNQTNNDDLENRGTELFSIPVKAGKRIYYFNVKSSRNNESYITITESRKRQLSDGTVVVDKHKIHLYKEDFVKFTTALTDALNYIEVNKSGSSMDNSQCPTLSEEDFINGF